MNRVLLVICDGMGHSDNTVKNAVRDANTPNLDYFYKNHPYALVEPGGEAVGLPDGVAGNSEVGHMNLGAGRPVRQDLVRINEAISNDSFKSLLEYKKLIEVTKKNTKRLHLLCLLSDGGVHAHIDHLKVIATYLKDEPEIEVFLHAFMDGRDTPKTNGLKYLEDIEASTNLKIASIQGRSIGMDRDRRWEKIELSMNTICGHGNTNDLSPQEYIKNEYRKEVFDEFITPTLFNKDWAIKDDDSIFFLNFRPDRARQISLAFNDPKFSHFIKPVSVGYFLCMSPYIDEEVPDVPILFNRENIPNTLSEYLSKKGLKQFKIAETEKYAHITYFFNGGADKPFQGEDRVLIDSPKDVATYDLKPEMSAPLVLENLLKALDNKDYSFYLVNFANPDMVGHTGNYQAAVKAMEVVDNCLGKLYQKCQDNNISMLITADHGNCDQMVYEDGSAHTSHSKAMVPLILLQNNSLTFQQNKKYALKDIAPTVLKLLNIEKHPQMSGEAIF